MLKVHVAGCPRSRSQSASLKISCKSISSNIYYRYDLQLNPHCWTFLQASNVHVSADLTIHESTKRGSFVSRADTLALLKVSGKPIKG
jgi:hypothetical protein